MDTVFISFLNHEQFRYCAGGERLTKCYPLTKNTSTQQQVRYLPGLEARRQQRLVKALNIITLSGVRVLHQQNSKPINSVYYSHADGNDSATLELDHHAQTVSGESYYPFGGTASWAVRGKLDRCGKTRRYAGKERDLSGLIYYGFRYYVAWLMRWLNADPAGTIDGLNLFRMVRNNPLTLSDPDGRGSVKSKAGTNTNRQLSDEGQRIAPLSPVQHIAGPSQANTLPAVSAPVSDSLLRAGCVEPKAGDSLLTWYRASKPYANGGKGVVFKLADGKLIKKYLTKDEYYLRRRTPGKKPLVRIDKYFTPTEMRYNLIFESIHFNDVHGENSSRVVKPDGLLMPNLGVPLTNELVKTIPVDALDTLIAQLNKLHKSGFLHGDLNEHNLVYNSENKQLHLINFSHVSQRMSGNIFFQKKSDAIEYWNKYGRLYRKSMKSYISESVEFWCETHRDYWSKGYMRESKRYRYPER